jgi:hypothetical protein
MSQVSFIILRFDHLTSHPWVHPSILQDILEQKFSDNLLKKLLEIL